MCVRGRVRVRVYASVHSFKCVRVLACRLVKLIVLIDVRVCVLVVLALKWACSAACTPTNSTSLARSGGSTASSSRRPAMHTTETRTRQPD